MILRNSALNLATHDLSFAGLGLVPWSGPLTTHAAKQYGELGGGTPTTMS
jgi:hypothetical protein